MPATDPTPAVMSRDLIQQQGHRLCPACRMHRLKRMMLCPDKEPSTNKDNKLFLHLEVTHLCGPAREKHQPMRNPPPPESFPPYPHCSHSILSFQPHCLGNQNNSPNIPGFPHTQELSWPWVGTIVIVFADEGTRRELNRAFPSGLSLWVTYSSSTLT